MMDGGYEMLVPARQNRAFCLDGRGGQTAVG
jgi:hypothetical protein